MTWFKVDDNFALHPKALLAGNAALGGWTRAGAWCAQQLTDGQIPAGILPSLGIRTRDAEALVKAGLWERTEAGYRFHAWEEYQPTRSEIEADRAATRKRQQEWRDRQRDIRDRNAVTNGVGNGVTNAAPTRPDPTISKRLSSPTADAADDQESRVDVERLCRHLADRIEANGSKRPTVTKGWRDACRLMLDRDGRTEEQVRRCIDWCQDDEFWKGNILSMPKLREKYDQLRLRAVNGSGAKPLDPGHSSSPWTPEPPPRDIEDDPAACDRWYRDQAAKHNARAS